MADITAAAVKDLRERSGAGMMDCKKALTENGGDMEAAIDWLRTKGLATAAKKSGRTAAEGLVGVTVEGKTGAAVEVNSETDFVAKNEQFQDFVRTVSKLALTTGNSIEALAAAPYPGSEGSVQDKLTANVATIGENQQLRRAKVVSVNEGAVVSYVHNAAGAGIGKIGVLVALEGSAPVEKIEALGKQLAMHIAAAFPQALNEEGLDEALVERERAIAMEKAAESGKPANIIEKMVEGAVAKFRKENALISQVFVMDNKTQIKDVIAAAAKEAGGSIALTDYVRFQLGEGIQKETSDFAAEVAAASGVPQQPAPVN
ncbi:translation elongation factor Ts [Sphingomonas nostoxanthinifaciens]|uniref:translation elongation factor Ts n=1 Tax=Sphingomonas nostoxanthinifaciens TaxID=2872652 RepID=UPI001CC20C0B|nr:translation elongation factor Ts [Sphingomonas nostoxanthinifaciens]UAK25342.1 translation elongation factor Ts [Sphingomonas nostoxanthinifaciens]